MREIIILQDLVSSVFFYSWAHYLELLQDPQLDQVHGIIYIIIDLKNYLYILVLSMILMLFWIICWFFLQENLV